MALVASPPVSLERVLSQRTWLDTLAALADRRWICWLCLACYCGWLFFYGLTEGEFYRTESLRAIVAAEFLRSGNWIVPTLYGEPLFTKPPGMYAAITLASWPFGGVREWTARLPSAIAASATVILLYWYFGRHLGRRAGLLAALILPISFLWLDKSSTAEIDMLQVFWVSASILFFLRGLEVIEDGKLKVEDRWAGSDVPKIEYRRIGFTFRAREVFPVVNAQDSAGAKRKQPTLDPPSSLWLWWLAALLCVAGGVLTKWTGAAFFYGTVIPLLWWRGQLRLLWGRHHLICAAIGAGMVLAWIVGAATMAGWQDLYSTVSREGLMRLSPSHHHRPYPWGESLGHPIRLLAASLPCSAFALLSLRPGFSAMWDDRGLRLLQAMHCWTWPNMLFWSVIPEHATRHSFPLFPGLAGLAALVWISWLRGKGVGSLFQPADNCRPINRIASRRAEKDSRPLKARVARLFIGLVFVWIVVKLVFVEAILPRRNPARQPKEKGEQLAALVPNGNMLYLFQVKDEGIMFYYGRPVRRLTDADQLPSSNRPIYCILDEAEWRSWKPERPAEMLLRMPDEQGDPIILVRVDQPGKLEVGSKRR